LFLVPRFNYKGGPRLTKAVCAFLPALSKVETGWLLAIRGLKYSPKNNL